MNPFFQEDWSDVHAAPIGFIREALSESLPSDLRARAEEHIAVSQEEKRASCRADVEVVEPWRGGFPPVAGISPNEGGAVVTVAEPLVFAEQAVPERWVEIRTGDGDLITVIEVLSPANKREPDHPDYRTRQSRLLSAGVRLVEIDLLLGGKRTVSVPSEKLVSKYPPGICHVVCATRIVGDEFRWEVYLCPLRQSLPVIRVPLRWNEPDVALALQPLVDRCYRTGRYWLSPMSVADLHPPLADEGEAVWVEERLRAATAG